jgi:hypothetical protein
MFSLDIQEIHHLAMLTFFSLESPNDFVDLEPNTVASQTLSYTAIPMTISRFNITTRLESNRDVPTEREIVLKQLIHKRNCTS